MATLSDKCKEYVYLNGKLRMLVAFSHGMGAPSYIVAKQACTDTLFPSLRLTVTKLLVTSFMSDYTTACFEQAFSRMTLSISVRQVRVAL